MERGQQGGCGSPETVGQQGAEPGRDSENQKGATLKDITKKKKKMWQKLMADDLVEEVAQFFKN